MQVHIIGAGLAGCEAAWQLAIRRIPVTLYEMRGIKQTPAHITSDFAELVCSNSFRSDNIETAVGLLHEEMRKAGSLILEIADRTKVPAGSALAVDRILFAQAVTERIKSHPLISIKNEEVKVIPLQEKVIIATGPLTSDALATEISKLIQEKYLSLF